jgi:hypothetical protein
MSRQGLAKDATTLPIRIVETWYTSEYAIERQVVRDKIVEQAMLAKKFPRPKSPPPPDYSLGSSTRYVEIEPETVIEEDVEPEFAA